MGAFMLCYVSGLVAGGLGHRAHLICNALVPNMRARSYFVK
jgi:hypothetical protein